MLDFSGSLQELKDKQRYRFLRPIDEAPGAWCVMEGRQVLNMTSNNYLGLALDPRVKNAAAEAAQKWGAGATASRLLGGSLRLHQELEECLAQWKGTEAAVVMPSGYHVNTGLLPALVGPDDVLLLDRLSHASLVDGARLSKGTLRVFRHNDLNDLESALRRRQGQGRCWVVTESVFSMDGDWAPLAEMVELAEKYHASLYVDEAHATGLFGPQGQGLVNALGLSQRVDVCVGTLSKALGGLGGYVVGSRTLVEWVHNRCRSFIYSTALPAPCVGAALTAIQLAQQEPWRREKVLSLAKLLSQQLGGPEAVSPIVPWVVGADARAPELANHLWQHNILAPAIRPPTVPEGQARLRFGLTASHTEKDVAHLVATLQSPVVS